MKKGNALFVRMDYRNDEAKWDEQIIQSHLEWAKKLAGERFFIGGGMESGPPCCLFEAKDISEAEEIIKNDPIIISGLYRYELHQWHMVVFSENIFE